MKSKNSLIGITEFHSIPNVTNGSNGLSKPRSIRENPVLPLTSLKR